MGEAQISRVFRFDVEARVNNISVFLVCFLHVWLRRERVSHLVVFFFFLRAALVKNEQFRNSCTRARRHEVLHWWVAHILTHYGWCYGRGQMVLAITSCLVSRCFALAAVAGSYCVDSTGANR